MMRRMLEVSVETAEDGIIHIKQPDLGQNEEQWVQITADQVDTLVTWLQEAKAEVLAREATSARQ
jgi:hypothetical protein